MAGRVIILCYLLVLPICSAVMGLLGFWIGRCARRLPIIDDKLLWMLHRNQIPAAGTNPAKAGPKASRWP
jgi:hypothetical protein